MGFPINLPLCIIQGLATMDHGIQSQILAMDAPSDYLNPYTAILDLYIATFLHLILIGGSGMSQLTTTPDNQLR